MDPEAAAQAAEAVQAAAEELNKEEDEGAPVAEPEPAAAPARPVDRLPYDSNLIRDRFKVQSMLRNGQISDTPLFQGYYTKYSIARWTQSDLHNQLHRFRQDIRNDLQLAKEPAHGQLVTLVLNAMKELIRPDKNYPPAAQANAMLMIGELNQVERATGIPPTPPTPSPDALALMLSIVDPAGETKYSDGIKVAALVGIRRHAETGLPSAAADAVTKAMLAILAAQPPQNSSADAHYWMQGQACEILGLIGQPGDRSIVVRALAFTLRSQAAPAGARAEAARALGRIKLTPSPEVNVTELAGNIAQFVVDVLDNELALYEDYEPVYRRRVKTALLAAQAGLTAIGGAASAAKDQEYVKDIVTLITDLMATLDDEELYEEEVVEGIQKAAEDLSAKVGTAGTG